MKKSIWRQSGRRAQTMTEYAIIVAVIALVCLAAISFLGEQISDTFTSAGEQLEDVNSDIDSGGDPVP